MITSFPIDITASAEACYAECEQMDSYGIVATISRYLSEERERCAGLAEQKIYPWSIAAGEELHEAIMSGEAVKTPPKPHSHPLHTGS